MAAFSMELTTSVNWRYVNLLCMAYTTRSAIEFLALTGSLAQEGLLLVYEESFNFHFSMLFFE